MASEIRVNQIQNRSGLSTVSFTDTGAVFSGITTISDLRTTGGLVGIGTNNPAYKLDVNATSNLVRFTGAGTTIRIEADSDVPRILFETNGQQKLAIGHRGSSASPANYTEIRTVTADPLLLFTNNTERVRIDSSGNLGIGITNPSTVFHIRQPGDNNGITISHATRIGKWRLEHSGVNSENFVFIQNNGTSDANTYVIGRDVYYWYTNNIERMSLTSSGNLGIGTAPTERAHIYSSGDVKLLVETPSSGVNANSALYLKTASEGNWLLQTGNAVSGGLRVYDATAALERVRIDSSGNLGIGITNPSYRLSTYGTGAVRHEVVCTDNNSTGAGIYLRTLNSGTQVSNATIRTNNSGTFSIFTGTTSDTENFKIDSSGRVQMPSQPSGAWALTVNASAVRSVSIKKNIGSHVSSVPGGNGSTHGSVGRFTAPVAGAYLISLFSTAVGPSSQCLMSVYGSWTSGTNNVAAGSEVFDCRATRPPEDGGGWSQVFYFNANDYWEIDWYRPSATAYIDSVMTMNVTVHLLG